MKSIKLILLALLFGSCGFFKDYTKDSEWSYFEEWDNNTDLKVDKSEFTEGCLRDGYVNKSDGSSSADSLFVSADEDKDGLLSGLEFYRWKIKM